MTGTKECVLCGVQATAKTINLGKDPGYMFHCDICGRYSTPEIDVLAKREYGGESNRRKLSALARYGTLRGKAPMKIEAERVNTILAGLVPTTIADQGRHLLRCLVLMSERLGHRVQVAEISDWPLGFCYPGELGFLLRYVEEFDWIAAKKYSDTEKWRVTVRPAGWVEDREAARTPDNPQCFVAMWFDASMDKAYSNGIAPAVQQAGYKPVRVDQVDSLNKIDDQILVEIRRSHLMVADMTGHRGGVYFEAGFAMGLEVPVFYTCRADDMGKCHFDTRQYPHIVWESEEDLQKQLHDRIVAILGQGPRPVEAEDYN